MNSWPIRKRLLAALVLALLVGCGGGDKDNNKGTETSGSGKKAATPEDAVKYLEEAARAGDMDGVNGQLTSELRSHRDSLIGAGKAGAAYHAALEAKFGKGDGESERGDRFGRRIKQVVLSALSDLQIVKKAAQRDDKVKLTIRLKVLDGNLSEHDDPNKEPEFKTAEEDWLAFKEDGAWKLVPPMMQREKDQHESEFQKGTMQKFTEVLTKETKLVKEGKYKTRHEAEEALFEAEEKLGLAGRSKPDKVDQKKGGKE